MTRIYYEVTPKFINFPRYAARGNFQHIYDLLHQITGSHECSYKVAKWCENAEVGQVFIHNLFEIVVIEDEV